MVNQIVTGNHNGTKVLTAGASGFAGGIVGKRVGDKVVSSLNKGFPNNSISSAGHNMTVSSSQRVLADSQSLTGAAVKSKKAELQVGSGYSTGSALGLAGADRQCSDYDKQVKSKGC